MTRSSAEVIVVGAGPAGAAAALLLARTGRDVLIVDRAEFPRPKPCGDCLSIGASALLERLGVLHRITAGPHATLRGWQIVAPNGSAFEAAFDDCAIAAERSVLDAVLVDAALAAGARLERFAVTDVERDARGHVCGVRSRDGVRTARLTVGADGLRSIVAQRLGALPRHGSLRKLSLTFHARVDGVGSVGEMHVGDGVCVGIAPVAGGERCNLTVVADSDRFGRAVADDPRAFARAVLHNRAALYVTFCGFISKVLRSHAA
jgi:2-polyprenyl-6-methoxyphenol hydroxylase-like FAD-dependent oxidoreductase